MYLMSWCIRACHLYLCPSIFTRSYSQPVAVRDSTSMYSSTYGKQVLYWRYSTFCRYSTYFCTYSMQYMFDSPLQGQDTWFWFWNRRFSTMQGLRCYLRAARGQDEQVHPNPNAQALIKLKTGKRAAAWGWGPTACKSVPCPRLEHTAKNKTY